MRDCVGVVLVLILVLLVFVFPINKKRRGGENECVWVVQKMDELR